MDISVEKNLINRFSKPVFETRGQGAGQMPITIKDVAAQAGVSKSTVSRYLNGYYESMSPSTKERISAVINELDYRPNALARSLKQKRTHTIAAIVANIMNPFSTTIIRGIEDYCKNAGFNLILCNADDDPVKEREYIEMLMAKQTDGFIMSTTEKNNEFISQVNLKTPVVVIGRNIPQTGCDTVTVDNFRGLSMAISHLASLGHRRIAMATLPYQGINPRTERIEGFKSALKEHGIDFREEWLIQSDGREEGLQDMLERLFIARPQPTAIFGVNDLMTMSLVKTLKKMGIRIPKDIAVMGFDDWEWAQYIEPPVTVVAQPAYEMGRRAAELLIKRLGAKKQKRKPVLAVYQPQLVSRRSCGEQGGWHG